MNHDDLPAYWSRLPRDGWLARAACAGKPRWWWFDECNSESEIAHRICSRCPVTDDCLAFAIRNEPEESRLRFGMFGGMTPVERHRFARLLRAIRVPLHFRAAA